MKPSDYFRRQIYGCFWFETASIPLVIDSIGADNIMFETDYPHPTCLYPNPLERVAKALEGVPAYTQRKFLQDNAASLYHVAL